MDDQDKPLGRFITRSWGIDGESEDGSPGEECGVVITIRTDGTGFIIAYMEHPTDRIQLSLTQEEVGEMIQLLT